MTAVWRVLRSWWHGHDIASLQAAEHARATLARVTQPKETS